MSLKKSLAYSQICDFLLNNTKEATDLYFNKGFTARQLAEHFNIVYNSNFQKACFRTLGDKGLGLGGARVGAGNLKGKAERKARKKGFTSVTVLFSPEDFEILQNSGVKHSEFILRSVRYYSKVLRNLEGKEDTELASE